MSYEPPSPEDRQPEPQPPAPERARGVPKWLWVTIVVVGGLIVWGLVGRDDDDEPDTPDIPSNEEILGPELVEQACDDLDDLIAANPELTRGEVIDQVVESFDDSAVEWRLRDVLWGCSD